MSESSPIKHPNWLTSGDFTEADEPLRLFAAWFDEATASEPRDPNAMALATVDADGPAQRAHGAAEGLRRARIRLLHQHREPQRARIGRSAEGSAAVSLEVARTGKCALRGPVERVTDAEADAYFAHAPAAGADRRLGEQAVGAAGKPAWRSKRRSRSPPPKFAIGTVPRPPHWSGYRLTPLVDGVLAGPALTGCTTASSSGATRSMQPWTQDAALSVSYDEVIAGRDLHGRTWSTPQINQPRRALLLTGASRGIGHATVKRFSAAGWRVITCSRHPFPENCPWEMGPEDHIQVDLADPDSTLRRHRRDQAAARRTASCTRWSTTPRSRPRPTAARG